MSQRIVAAPATGADLLYRVVSRDGPQLDDFRGCRELPRHRPVPPETPWLLLVGISMFDTPQAALQIARRRPAGLARVRLQPDLGIHFAATAGAATTPYGAPQACSS
jgi:hypothetical protein